MSLQGLHLHFDAPSGVAGDMTLGALFDLGVPEAAVRDVLARLPLTGYRLEALPARRGGLVGTDVKVHIDGDPGHAHHHHEQHELDHHPHHPHRHYRDIRALVAAGCEGRVRELALAIFDKVGAAEAKLHGLPIDEVSFHEVGAVDSIVDIVGAAAALAWLAPRRVTSTPLPLGHGSVRVAHGLLPVPAPATLEICRAANVPTYDGGAAFELTTPTGAAILATVVDEWGVMPPLLVRAAGYGAGDRDLADRPNLLRAVVGEPGAGAGARADDVFVIECNLDDMSPELAEHVTDRLLEAGALDVWWTPATMKKSRPAFVLGVLSPAARREPLSALILAETTTLGVRYTPAQRATLERRQERVDTPYGPVTVKLGLDAGAVVNVAPEYESCRAVARERGVPLKTVYAAALAAFSRR